MGAAGGESISGDGKWQMKGEASRGGRKGCVLFYYMANFHSLSWLLCPLHQFLMKIFILFVKLRISDSPYSSNLIELMITFIDARNHVNPYVRDNTDAAIPKLHFYLLPREMSN